MSGFALTPCFPWPGVTGCEGPTDAPVIAPVIGWLDPVTNSFGTAAHANAGATFNRQLGYDLYAGVVGYTAGAVVWSLEWTPTEGGPPPSLVPVGADKVQVVWPDASGNPYFPSLGLLLVTATVGGVSTAVGQGIEAVTINSDYGTQAWAPEA